VGSVFDLRDAYLKRVKMCASRINSRNASVFWESERNMDLLHTFLKRKHTVEGNQDKDLLQWIDQFDANKKEASLGFWYEMHKGIQESLREF
jgi:glyceraldehyde-3-phosphate dehydrogenase (ferredoxin)